MSLIDTLSQRSPRERVLLAVLAVVVLPVALAFGVLLPLQEARTAAQVELAQAQALNTWVANRAGEAAALGEGAASSAQVPRPAPIGLSALEQSLQSANLRPAVSRLEARSNGGISLEFAAVDFIDLMQWIDARDPAWGYVITSARIEPDRAPALVRAAFVLSEAD